MATKTTNKMTPQRWILEGEVGVSSKTMYAALTGTITEPTQCSRHYDTPKDPDDFKRCWKLIVLFPEWRKRLDIVGKVFPKWQPFIREWRWLEALYIEEAPSGSCPKLYELLQRLNDEGMALDGWMKTGKHSWERPDKERDNR